MGIGRFLIHRVSIARAVVTLDEEGDPVLDDYGQPVTTASTVEDVAAAIQPHSAEELAAISQAGVSSSTHRIYMLPRDISTADAIVHDPDDCPMPTDLPLGTYQVVFPADAAGSGRHIEIRAKLVGSPTAAYATPVGGGS